MLSSLLDRIKEPKMLLDVVKNEDRRKVLVVAITSIGVLYIVVKRITRKKVQYVLIFRNSLHSEDQLEGTKRLSFDWACH